MGRMDGPASFRCMGCSIELGRPDSLLARDQVRYVAGRDGNRHFFECTACGGRNYYLVREGSGLVFLEFHEAPRRADASSGAARQGTFLGCLGAALAVLGLVKFISELFSEVLLPYPPVTLFTAFVAWAVAYLITLVTSAAGSRPG